MGKSIYKGLATFAFVAFTFGVLDATQPVVTVRDGMVIEVDGRPTYRKLTNFDLRECKIINE